MKFYDRVDELKNLQEIKDASLKSSKMSIIYGRRRVGKTTLVKEAFKDRVYLFVSKKNEAILCEEFIDIVSNSLDIKIFGEFKSSP